MNHFKHVRDTLTGLFTKSRDPATTVAESPTPGLSRLNRRILANAIADERNCTGAHSANKVLRDAVLKVLETPTR